MFAVLNIHKPIGWTSHDVVACLRRVYGLKKIGHLGTLDPLAEGVLPLCLGGATRLIEYFPSTKRYTAKVTLGRTTTTLDREGEELSSTDCTNLDLSLARLQPLLAQFTGTIMQQVPLYSAVHVSGKKLYEMARQGKTADLPIRQTIIMRLALLDLDTQDLGHPVLTLDVQCSSGTYIRSLARDIGEALGCGAFLSGLVRTEHGNFTLSSAILLEALRQSENPSAALQNPLTFLDMPIVNLATEEDARRLSNGIKIEPTMSAMDGDLPQLKPNAFYMTVFGGNPLGVVQVVSQKLKPVKMFSGQVGA
jgi:tRNA pseudouridine55 synthase